MLLSLPATPAPVRIGRLLALVVILIGALTLGEDLFGWQLDVDELLFRDIDPSQPFTTAPGRMAISSMITFCLLGFALLAIDWNWKPVHWLVPAEALAQLVFAMSSMTAVEYAFGRMIVNPAFDSTRMAVGGGPDILNKQQRSISGFEPVMTTQPLEVAAEVCRRQIPAATT